MTHLDLFSGIGGNSLAADSIWPGIQHIFCENADFPAAILRKHWPNAKIYGDIKELKGAEILEGGIDLLTGGFPCQPFSSAGKRGGTEDDRHLWPEMLRVIRNNSRMDYR
jgi:DNA (cytosine-5)-methyltransferase 1